jgi:hypothetical protein
MRDTRYNAECPITYCSITFKEATFNKLFDKSVIFVSSCIGERLLCFFTTEPEMTVEFVLAMK